MPPLKRVRRAMIASSSYPFLCVCHDGKHKTRHNKEVMFILSLLKKAGVREYNLHHIKDAELSGEIPIVKNRKIYDIGYCSPDGEVFLIEIMRAKRCTS